jgi:hypothetical protein
MLSKHFPFKKDIAAIALTAPECPALVLYAIVVAAYGDVLYGDKRDELDHDGILEPVEMWMMIRRDFGVDTDVEVENRINAMRTAVETDAFYEDTEAFSAIVKAIADGDIDDAITGIFEELSIAEIIIAMFEVAAVRKDPPVFANSVMGLITSEAEKEAEEEHSGNPTQAVVERHKREIKDWFIRLGANADLVKNF